MYNDATEQAFVARAMIEVVKAEVANPTEYVEGVQGIDGVPGWEYRIWRDKPVAGCSLIVVIGPDQVSIAELVARLQDHVGYLHGYDRFVLLSVLSATTEERAKLCG